MTNENKIQVMPPAPAAIERNSPTSFAPRNLQEAMQFADLLLTSGMAPKGYRDIIVKSTDKKEGSEAARAAVVIALQFGAELGLQPMQSLQNIASINGNPAIWGDAALGLVHSSGVCEYVIEQDFDTIKKDQKATCRAKRKGSPEEVVRTFSYDDARAAGIFGNAVWKTYPYRMCQMRARSFALRDAFPDVLKGLVLAEEVQDYVEAEPRPAPIERVVAPAQIEAQIQAEEVATQQAATQEEIAEAPAAQVAPQTDSVTGLDWAKDYYRAYAANKYTVEDSKQKITEVVGVYTDSRAIPSRFAKELMEWATTPNPKYAVNMDSEP